MRHLIKVVFGKDANDTEGKFIHTKDVIGVEPFVIEKHRNAE